jgi:hypothetical protein
VLHFVSDRSGWWNLYRFDGGACIPLCPREAEFGSPHWTFGGSMYGFRSDARSSAPISRTASAAWPAVDRAAAAEPIATPYQEIRELRVSGDIVALLGGAPTIALELARIDLATGRREVLARRSRAAGRGLSVGPAEHQLPERQWPHRARLLLPAANRDFTNRCRASCRR